MISARRRKSKSKASKNNFLIAKVTERERIIFKNSFEEALMDKGIIFTDDLLFSYGTLLDPSEEIQKMPPFMIKTYEDFKEMSRKKVYAPLILIKDDI
jgi:hypothetical protein